MVDQNPVPAPRSSRPLSKEAPKVVNGFREKVAWQDRDITQALGKKNPIDAAQRKQASSRPPGQANGIKDTGKSVLDESKAQILKGEDVADADAPLASAIDVVEISSDEEEEISDASESGSESGNGSDREKDKDNPNQTSAIADTSMTDLPADEDDGKDGGEADEADETGDAAEPTFGELIRAVASSPIDVEAALADPGNPSTSFASAASQALQLNTGPSLGVVLSQSLRTNDVSLLETCLHVNELDIIRSTIERLESPLAVTLLHRLAERLHRRPGRSGNLMVWIQWTLVSHGGYLASQPETLKKLAVLHRVVKERASSLQSLLSLKGKLDLLDAQMQLRKGMERGRHAPAIEDDPEDERIIYVEGQEESDSEDEMDHDSGVHSSKQDLRIDDTTLANGSAAGVSDSDEDDDESDDDEDMPTTTNGIAESDEEEDSGSDDGLIDDEAEETDADTGDEDDDEDEVDSVDLEDSEGESLGEDDEEEEEESEPEGPPPKRRSVMLPNGAISAKASRSR